MAAVKTEGAGWVTSEADAWNPETNPAVTNLLDHLAEELAKEYVRLMERAVEDEATQIPECPRRKESQR